MNNHLSI